MKKQLLDLTVTHNEWLNNRNVLLKLTHHSALPKMLPGQFVQIEVPDGNVFLRRPISIHYIDKRSNELWLLVQVVGKGTKSLSDLKTGALVNLLLPLGNSFSMAKRMERVLLVGGGVGIAPLLLLGELLHQNGAIVHFLLGGGSSADLLQLNCFSALGTVHTTTEDGSAGQKGVVTQHTIWDSTSFHRVYTCGPTPMMKAVAALSKERGYSCEVSLENSMACGIGACLCCVTDSRDGHVCVCTDGPVFNTTTLKW